MNNDAGKVTADRLRRDAYLYVRQSTLYQVVHNTESTRRQYDLKGRAVALGWQASQIHVIDVDQGSSGASAGSCGSSMSAGAAGPGGTPGRMITRRICTGGGSIRPGRGWLPRRGTGSWRW